MKHTHGRYAFYWKVLHNSSGHARQGRYTAFVRSVALHGAESGVSEIGARGPRVGMVERRCSL